MLLGGVALALLPWVLSEYHTHVGIVSLYYVILAIGWNLLAGYAGQFSLAHHTFAGIGAYTSALLVHHTGIPIVAGIAAGVVLASVVGYVLGTLCLGRDPHGPLRPPRPRRHPRLSFRPPRSR